MTSERRFDQDLPDLLAQVAQAPAPDYRDLIVQRTARTRQRPAWTFPERWLPMSAVTSRTATVPRLPLRIVAAVALLLIALIVGAIVFAGSQHPLPAPFGIARNGLVAYAEGGDIYVGDPATGRSTAIVTGPENDVNPRWSRDGTRVAFERRADANSYSGVVYVARPGRSDLIRVTPDSLLGITSYDFSPDGKQLLISADQTGIPSLFIAATDGSGIRQLKIGMAATNAAWRPPNGSEILFTDFDNGDPSGGSGAIHLVSSLGGDVRTIVSDERSAGIYRGQPMWSPDGSLLAYGEWCSSDCSTGKALASNIGNTVQTYIVKADGSVDHVLPSPAGQWQAPESWSNDGTKVLVIRGPEVNSAGTARPAVVPVHGSAVGVEIPYPPGVGADPTLAWAWAPDDTSILGTPTGASGIVLGQVLLDPVKGTGRTLGWSSVSQPSWQRIGP